MVIPSLSEFVEPVNVHRLSDDEGYLPGQIGQILLEKNDIDAAHLVIIGCDEWRGTGARRTTQGANMVRSQLYNLYHWHTDLVLADVGNVFPGMSLNDSYAALKLVVHELLKAGKRVLVIGGSHDNTVPLYHAFAGRKMLIEATIIDALLDLERDNPQYSRRFLLDMLTTEPNYLKHFSLVGFQSYFAFPSLLETIDKLRFDCYRVGRVQERIEEVEPAIRGSQLLSFDLCAMAHAYAPATTLSPNGFTGQDACKLMQYAGMSKELKVTGLFGFDGNDATGLTAMQLAQMIWYFMDGMQKANHETSLDDRSGFNEFHTLCAEVDTLFLQSRNTGRWWMQLPDESFIPCAYSDYLAASNNDLPERWLRVQERN
jgi:arginase family enzyme